MILYRPVGLFELKKISNLEFKGFPPRFETQPIFYPVLNEGYAIQIAKEWNTTDKTSGYVGYVTRFEVDDAYVSRFERQVVGNQSHEELWVPSEELEEFNSHIVGKIEVTQAFHSQEFLQGLRLEGERWNQELELVQSIIWQPKVDFKCHEHCDACQSKLCSEHPAGTGVDWQTGYSGKKDGVEYFLCPPCFALFQELSEPNLRP